MAESLPIFTAKAPPQAAKAPAGLEEEYGRWIETFDTPSRETLCAMAATAANLNDPPLVTVILTGNGATIGSGAERSATIASLNQQTYRHWQMLIPIGSDEPDPPGAKVRALPSAAFGAAIDEARGRYVTFVEAGDKLPPQALQIMVEAAAKTPGLVYSDEDELDLKERKRCRPYFKPDWNYDLFLAQDFACRLAMLPTASVRGLGRGTASRRAVYDLILQLLAANPELPVHHVPRVLYHRRSAIKLAETEVQLMRRSVEEHVQALPRAAGIAAPTVTSLEPDLRRVVWRLPAVPPRLSVIIPTRDRVDLLRQCVNGIRFATDYPDIEILIIDNGSAEPETRAYYASLASDVRVRIIPHEGPFNYSAINNAAARHASGGLLALLNNDIKVHEPGWLREMAAQAMRPGIGAVGALLWYEDGSVQHAGAVLGIGGVASHIFKRHPPGSAGYRSRLHVAQDMSAVTAACLVVPRAVWDRVGGLDEVLSIAYNDIDLCLRIRQAGYRVVWTPHARLWHLESASRGREDSPEKLARFNREKARMVSRWSALLHNDPHFNPNLSLTSTDVRLAFPPRVDYAMKA